MDDDSILAILDEDFEVDLFHFDGDKPELLGHLEWRSQYTIGRKEGADFVVNKPTISSKHAEIITRDGIIELRDLESRNGTFVGGKQIQSVVLFRGTEFRLAKERFLLQINGRPSINHPKGSSGSNDSKEN